MPDFTPDYFSAHLTDDPAKEPIAVGESIPGIIATAANKLGRDRKDFSVERITASKTGHSRNFCPRKEERCPTFH
jgi:hypothetical protein